MTGYAIILASGRLEELQAIGNIASVGAASGVPIDVFATMDGLEAFDKERIEAMDFEMGPVAEAMLSNEDMEMSLFVDNLARAKDLGPIEVYACELSMDALGKSLDDYADVFDGVLGVSGFFGHAQDKQVMFV
ncbi:hypothetical protein [Haloglomus litoreum]|uniref:hypothetical protein n=1 Tax=Haloglomus litoreum TaxID=3034026 RepID=UPI0023E87364|nr:hypothetical protein [Haloglomus sp. DT116]